ncbi:MAG: glutathione peroxidase [Clostridia bacterium]|nr:glutathione peroxidase [Clostridia bacterium]MBQ8469595.1 glutathione peroxidase [Clostridia bacterium]MBR1704271.1 glutathione peroxidase [Clostridia bacterium]
MGFYDFTVKDGLGADVSLSDYKGKVLLVVNTATGCGFTPQYEGLETLYEKYKDQGFEILDFPCNQFANQAPGTDGEIQQFCKARYNVQFKTFKKIKVNGPDAEPLYKWLKEQKKGAVGSRIKWNFTKFLIDREGNVVARFAPTETPEKLDAKVAELL